MASIFGEVTLPEQLAFSYLIGRAGGTAVAPLLVGLEQSAFLALIASGAFVAPNAILLAEGVAQGQINPKTAAEWASYQGFGGDQFNAMVDIANTGPGSAYAFEMWRRGLIGEPGFRRAVKRLGWEQEWIDDAVSLKEIRLSPEALAVMIQRSVVPNPGILPNQPPTANSDVPPMPVVDLDVFAEAEAHGVDADRLKAMARIIGLPASPDLAARMHFRGIINEDAFNQAIKEGNTRGEWAPFLLHGFREIPTAEQFVEAHLRGWITKQEMYDGTALHGMSEPNTDLEFEIHRRPMTVRQITQALAWGGTFNPSANEIQDPYSASVHQANLGPEWYDLAESLKHTYSVPFWWRNLAQAGVLDPSEAETILLRIGNPPTFAKKAVAFYTGGTTTAADPHVTKAENQLWTTLHRSYVAAETDDATATATLPLAGAAAGAVAGVLERWQAERELIRKQLTPAQIKKAYANAAVNAATDLPWTRDEALAALIERGYATEQASSYLNI